MCLTIVNDKGKPYGMEINVMKTKSMVANRKQETPKVSISLDGTTIEQVQNGFIGKYNNRRW